LGHEGELGCQKKQKKTVGCHGDWAEKMKENRKMFFFEFWQLI
jgi:hypothetical protein